MSTVALLEEFDRLPSDEQRQFGTAVLHRVARLDHGPPSDEELVAAAGTVFALLDAEEDGQPKP